MQFQLCNFSMLFQLWSFNKYMKFSDLANSFKPNIFDRLRDSYSTFWHTKNAETNSTWDLTKPRVGADQKGSAAPQYVHFITSAHFWGGSGSHLLTKIGGYQSWPNGYATWLVSRGIFVLSSFCCEFLQNKAVNIHYLKTE